MISLIRAEDSEYTKQLFKSMVLELVKYHGEYADKAGIQDDVVSGYTLDKAGRHLGQLGYYNYIIDKGGVYVGIVQVEPIISEFNSKPALIIYKIYITKLAQNTGVFQDTLEVLKQYFPDIKSIELDCWYNLPAEEVYKHLGFKSAYTHYFKEIK